MRNAGLNRMHCCISCARITKKQAARQVMYKPCCAPIWCYLGQTLDSTQMTVIIQTSKSATLEQYASVEIPAGIERRPLVRSSIVPQTTYTAAEAVSRMPEFAQRAKVINLKSCFRTAQDYLHHARAAHQCGQTDRQSRRVRNNNRMVEFDFFECRTFR